MKPTTDFLKSLLAASLLTLAAAPLPAAESGYRPLTALQVERREFRTGEKVEVTGKYHELINRELRLFDVPARFLVTRDQVGRQLFELRPERDNLTVRGYFRDRGKEGATGPEGLPSFEVEAVQEAPGDGELFKGRLDEMLRKPGVEAAELWRLGEDATAQLKRFGDVDLGPVAARALTEAYRRSEAALAPTDAGGRLKLVKRVLEAAGPCELVVELLRGLARQFPSHAATIDLLRELHCVQLNGEWLTHGEYKRRLGFVERGDQWVKPARKELLDLADELAREKEAHTNLILRTRTDREYNFLAQGGKVERGMTREELAESLGLPERVERRAREGLEIDQWLYPDRRVYLLNGQVLSVSQ